MNFFHFISDDLLFSHLPRISSISSISTILNAAGTIAQAISSDFLSSFTQHFLYISRFSPQSAENARILPKILPQTYAIHAVGPSVADTGFGGCHFRKMAEL